MGIEVKGQATDPALLATIWGRSSVPQKGHRSFNESRGQRSLLPSHSSSGRVPDSLPDGVSRASRFMSREGVWSDSGARPSLLGSWESRRLSVRLSDGATSRFLATVPDSERLLGGSRRQGRHRTKSDENKDGCCCDIIKVAAWKYAV